MRKLVWSLILAGSLIACTGKEVTMDDIAERYVKLVLKMGMYDADYVDAYYGPDEWKPTESEKKDKFPYETFNTEIETLGEQLAAIDPESLPEMDRMRHKFLRTSFKAVSMRIEMLNGGRFSFDEESAALYDAVAPKKERAGFQDTIDRLSELLPGKGSVSERLDIFKKQFVIPLDKLDAVFTAAIDEGRKRTLSHIDLPKDESFDVEYVNDKAWSAYNWYKGNSHSLIQVNTDLPIFIDRAIDLACHEGYPGHHVYNALLEKHLVRERNWMEFSVYPLFSPQSLIAEGSANYGIDVAFPGKERIEFEKDVLFPLAGLDPKSADKYYEVLALEAKLDYAGNEAARAYLDGDMDKGQTVAFLVDYRLSSPDRAEQRVRFIEKYRSYVINYNLGKDMVAEFVETGGGTADHPEKRWEIFKELLSKPFVPSGLTMK